MHENISFKDLLIGLLAGFIFTLIFFAVSMEDFEPIYQTENGFTVEHKGKFYKLVEIDTI